MGEREELQKMGRSATEGPPAVAAATVILTRDSPSENKVRENSAGEILMLRRDSRLSFAGGLWVFPGGRLDPEDFDQGMADSTNPAHVHRAERNAAAREAAEESGLHVEPADMVRFSHWTPPPQAPKRFSTAFFIGPAPEGDIMIDDGEIRDHQWVSPSGALHAHRLGTIELAPPTFITLIQLATSAAVNTSMTNAASPISEVDHVENALSSLPSQRSMIDAARSNATEHFSTRIAEIDAHIVALYHGDVGYEGSDPNQSGPRHRLWLDPAGWRYERTVPPAH